MAFPGDECNSQKAWSFFSPIFRLQHTGRPVKIYVGCQCPAAINTGNSALTRVNLKESTAYHLRNVQSPHPKACPSHTADYDRVSPSDILLFCTYCLFTMLKCKQGAAPDISFCQRDLRHLQPARANAHMPSCLLGAAGSCVARRP